MSTETFFDVDTTNSLKQDIIAFIKARDEATPRHQQRELGPSEVAHPCVRKLAYGLLQVDRCNPSFDPLPSIVGTATHKWMESAAMHANNILGRKRWHAEVRVNPAPWLSGSCDLYDADTRTVIDYKFPGNGRFKAYAKNMNPVYRMQVHLYGKGFLNAGLPVDTVAVMLMPRGGTLASAHLWSEPYDEAIVAEVLARHEQTVMLLNDFDIEAHPERFDWLEKSGPDCMFCPWFALNPSTPLQCPGVDDKAPQLNNATNS